MKAMRLEKTASEFTLAESDIPLPIPGPGEVLIKVHAAGVTAGELRWYPTQHRKDGQPRLHAIPGHEFSGVVVAVGEDVTTFNGGDEVYGMNDWFNDGATAEYCVSDPSSIASKPKTLTHGEAATVPIAALTAWQGLITRGKVKASDRILIHGGAGAVGIFAVQLACLQGAYVIATASAKNADFVTRLGAQQVIDYKTERFEDSVRDVDVVFDTVGGETLRHSWGVLKPGGRLITIATDSEISTDERVKKAFFIVEANRDQLIEVGKLLDTGKIRTFVNAVVPLSQADRAYTGSIDGKRGYGKVVVRITPQDSQH